MLSEAQYAAISGALANNVIVAAVAGKKIRVLSLCVIPEAAVTMRFESTSGGDPLTGAMDVLANAAVKFGYNPLGHFETNTGELLNLELGGTIQVSGVLTYVLVD